MREPYKVGVWGPGVVGKCAIRDINALPEFELVAVFGYSPAKHGLDAGLAAGCGEMGVAITGDVAAFLAAKPEVVIYATRDSGSFASDTDILMLLEAGVNVVTPLPYFNFRERGEALAALTAAAEKGGATLHATGISPTFMFERLGALLTEMSNNIESITLYEYFNIEHKGEGGAELSKAFGMGSRKEDVQSSSRLTQLTDNYFRQSIFTLAETLGVAVERVERTPHHEEVAEDLHVPGLIDIAKGQVGVVSHKWVGYSEGRPFFTYHVHWYAHSSICPEKGRGHGDDYWLLEIEGNPSSRVGIELRHTLKEGAMASSHLAVPAFMATVTTLLHAIPHVVDAAPGFMGTDGPGIHWKKDMRK